MANARLYSGLGLIVVGVILFSNVVPLSGVNQPCLQSGLTSCGGGYASALGIVQPPFWGGVRMSGVPGAAPSTISSATVTLKYQLAYNPSTGTFNKLTTETATYCTVAAQQDLSGNWITCPATNPLTTTDSFNAGTDVGIITTSGVSSSPGNAVDVKVVLSDGTTTLTLVYAVVIVANSYTYVVLVIDSNTQSPVPGATVNLASSTTDTTSPSPNWYATQTTGADGKATFNVPFGAYPTFQVSAPFYQQSALTSGFPLNTPSGTIKTVSLVPTSNTVQFLVDEKVVGGSCPTSGVGGAVVKLSTGQSGSVVNTGPNTGEVTITGITGGSVTGTVSKSGFLNATIPAFNPALNTVVVVLLTPTAANSASSTSCLVTPPGPSSCVPTGTNAAIYVLVQDVNTNKPVSGATVSSAGAGSVIGTTASDGSACLNNIQVPLDNPTGCALGAGCTGSVRVTVFSGNYSSASQSVVLKQGATSSVVFTLTPKGFNFGSLGTGQILGGVFIVGGLVLALSGRKRK